MKKNLFKISFLSLLFLFASCEKNDTDVNNPLKPANPDDLYAKTEYNLDMRDFAIAVNEAVNTNKSFRKLVKNEVDKMFDGDYNVLLTQIVDANVENYKTDGNGTIMRAPGSVSVRDLLNSSFSKVIKKDVRKVNNATEVSRKTPVVSLIDHLIEQYPALQIAVPFLEEQLEDENYIPPVVFLPEEYSEQTTEYLPAIRNNKEYAQNAKVLPNSACIVISENERIPILISKDTSPLVPIKLTGEKTNAGISLSWTMPIETNESNTIGYKIYRKTGESQFELIYTNISPYNRSYIDNNLEFNKYYHYYVVAYNDFKSSPAIYCNDGKPIFVDTRPTGATSFVVNPIGPNKVRFRWKFGDSDNNGMLNIYKRSYYTEEFSNPFYAKTLPVNGDECVASDVPAGSQLEYRIERTTTMGTSAPDYDILYMPYRDVTKKSSVYIKRLKHSDVPKIESWRGAPEYLIKGWRVKNDGTNLSVVEEFSTRIDCTSGKNNVWFNANKLVMSDWQPGFDGAAWYDKISLYAIELDNKGGLLDNIGRSAQSAQKIYTEWGKISSGKSGDKKQSVVSTPSKLKTVSPTVVAAVVVTAVEVAGLITKWVKSEDDRIGFMYLDYYEKPNKTIDIPAEAGGFFTMELSDTPN